MQERPSVRKILTFRDLDVWQRSMMLAEICYAAAAKLPKTETFGLATQMRRAAVSVPSNIAEGHQLPPAAYRHHVSVALGSLAELQTQIELARRIGLLDGEAQILQRHSDRVRQMLVRLRASLRNRR